MRRLCLTIASLLLFLPLALGDEKKPASPDMKALMPFLDERTVAVLQVDLTRLDPAAVEKQFSLLPKLKPGATEKQSKEVVELITGLKNLGVTRVDTVFSLADLPERPPILLFHAGDPAKVKESLSEKKLFPEAVFEVHDKVVVGAAEKTQARLREQKPMRRQDLEQAFAAADGAVIQLALLAAPATRRILDEVMPTLPEPLGGGSIKVLTRGLQWIVLRLDLEPKLDLKLLVKTADNDSALALKKLADRALELVGEQKAFRSELPAFDKVRKLLTPEVQEDQLKLQIAGPELIALLLPPVEKVRLNAQRTQSMNNLKQLVLAMHNYHSTYQSFPAHATKNKEGKALLSWRVHLLPFLAQDKLYKEFHLDEPWDSEHNKKLIARMPDVFASPTNPKLAADGKTTYLVPFGKDTLFAGFKGMKITEITDGTSNTIMLVDADDDHAVIWTKPEDLKYDAKEPLKGLGFKYDGSFLSAFADGSVHALKKSIDKDTLRALFTPNGGEAVTPR
jgi:Protein of unknown function (DUF1559)